MQKSSHHWDRPPLKSEGLGIAFVIIEMYVQVRWERDVECGCYEGVFGGIEIWIGKSFQKVKPIDWFYETAYFGTLYVGVDLDRDVVVGKMVGGEVVFGGCCC